MTSLVSPSDDLIIFQVSNLYLVNLSLSLADTGGFMGLAMGASIISLLELLYFYGGLIYFKIIWLFGRVKKTP